MKSLLIFFMFIFQACGNFAHVVAPGSHGDSVMVQATKEKEPSTEEQRLMFLF